jgi:NADPH:quinone reductase-like Zn-dependent oxidoreductase
MAMKAVLLKGRGGFEQLEYREDVQVPEPAAGEVLIQVGAAGVNNTDINTRTGWYATAVTEGTTASGAAAGYADLAREASGWSGRPAQFPRIQGADACGRIVRTGAGVSPTRVGERVLIEPAFRVPGGSPFKVLYFGSECDGAFAEFAVAPSAHAHSIASALTDVELASFPCAYSAAENLLARANVRTGETVLVTGASGGVGSAAVQLARRRGARIIAVAASSKAAAVAALGAEQVLDRAADVGEALGAESVDVVIDVAGGAGFAARLAVLRRGGRYATAGAIAGPVVALDLRTLYLKDLSFYGATVLGAGVFASLVRYIEANEIRPLVAAVLPLSQIVLAQQQFLAKAHTGKIVLVP